MAVMRDAIEDHRGLVRPRPAHDLRTDRSRGRPLPRPRNRNPPHDTIRHGALPCAQPRRAVRPLRGTPATKICRRRLPEALDTGIGQRPQTGGTACADSRHGTAARSLRADLRRGIPELIPGEGIPYYDSGNSRHRVRNPTCNGTQQGKTKRERKRPIPADPFKHNIPRRPQQISGEYFYHAAARKGYSASCGKYFIYCTRWYTSLSALP